MDLKHALPKTWSSPTMSPIATTNQMQRLRQGDRPPPRHEGEEQGMDRRVNTVNGIRVTTNDGTV